MEPVSLVASILTLITATQATAKVILNWWEAYHGSATLSKAMNEVRRHGLEDVAHFSQTLLLIGLQANDFLAMLELARTTLGSPGIEETVDHNILARIETLIADSKRQVDAFQASLSTPAQGSKIVKDNSRRISRFIRNVSGETQRELEVLCKELTSITIKLNTILLMGNM